MDKSYAEDAQKTKDARNKKRNVYKEEQKQIKRDRNSASLVLKIICKVNGKEYGDKATKGDFSFQVPKTDIIFEKFDKLLPKCHLNGLVLLLEEDVFMHCYDSVHSECNLLRKKQVETTQKTAERRGKQKQKLAAENSQRRISF